jgi:hypothetical protein
MGHQDGDTAIRAGHPDGGTPIRAGYPPVPNRGKRKIIAIAGLALVSIIALLAGAYTYRIHLAQRELEQTLAALDRDEPGWRLKNLEEKRRTVPEDQNSGPIILKLRAQMPPNWWKDDPKETWHELGPGEELPPSQASLLGEKIVKVEKLLPELRLLADRPRGHFPIHWTADAISTVLPHMDAIRPMATVLQADAYWQVHQGDLNGALTSCRAIVSVGRSVEGEPTLIAQLVHAVCLNLAVKSAQHTLTAGEPPEPALAALQDALAEADRHDPFVLAMRGERAGMNELFTNVENGTVSLPALLAIIGARGGTGFGLVDQAVDFTMASSARASHVWMMKHLTAGIETAQRPGKDQAAQLQAIEGEARSAPQMARLLTPAWARAHESIRRGQARLRCGIVGVALERYRLKHGRWPADLAALVPELLKEVPADPCANEPLQYRKTANGVVVFSVGPVGALKGDHYNLPLPDPAIAASSNTQEELFEFRLWNPADRSKPLSERVAP